MRAWQPTPVFLPGESPWTEEPGGLQSMGSQRVGHDGAPKHSTAHGQLTGHNAIYGSTWPIDGAQCYLWFNMAPFKADFTFLSDLLFLIGGGWANTHQDS